MNERRRAPVGGEHTHERQRHSLEISPCATILCAGARDCDEQCTRLDVRRAVDIQSCALWDRWKQAQETVRYPINQYKSRSQCPCLLQLARKGLATLVVCHLATGHARRLLAFVTEWSSLLTEVRAPQSRCARCVCDTAGIYERSVSSRWYAS